jgi:hypothetical protein
VLGELPDELHEAVALFIQMKGLTMKKDFFTNSSTGIQLTARRLVSHCIKETITLLAKSCRRKGLL